MKGYGLFYYIAEAFRGLRANSVVNLLALGTITMAMVIVGFFLILFFNVRTAVTAISDRMEMSVYLKDGLSPQERDFLKRRLALEPEVRQVTFLPRAEALALFRKELAGQEALIEGLGENPLPDSFELRIDRRPLDADRLAALAGRINRFHGVEEVSYGRRGAEALSGLFRTLQYVGLVLTALLGVSIMFIVSNSVRLALYSRGQEIELMQWIGATRGFIQGPFLIEGMLLSMIGSGLAVGILAVLYALLPQEAASLLAHPFGIDFLPLPAVAVMIVGGGLLGLAGGLVSVNKFLE